MCCWLVMAVLLSPCSAAPAGEERGGARGARPAPGGPPIRDLEGGWVLSRAWEGHMGVAIHFRANGTFDYWFHSDVPRPGAPRYPVRGKWKWDGAVLQLEAQYRLHATRWHVYRHGGESCLLPEYARRWQQADGQPHADRLLFRIPGFDPARPFDKRR